MCFYYIILSFFLSIYSNFLYACEYKNNGKLNIINKNINCIYNNGMLTLIDAEVKNETNNTGMFSGKNIAISDFKNTGKVVLSGRNSINGNVYITGKTELSGNNTINGNVYITGKTELSGSNLINGNVNITGELESSNTVFKKQITIAALIIRLNKNTITSDIVVKKMKKSFDTEEKIYINSSIVDGNINFESGKGKIILSNGGKITGLLTGGMLSRNNLLEAIAIVGLTFFNKTSI